MNQPSESNRKKSIQQIMRTLHRDVSYFTLGLILIYALAGLTLIYRDTEFLKKEKNKTMTLEAGTDPSQVGQALRMRDFEIISADGDMVFFKGGSYNQATGEVTYTVNELVFPLNKFTSLHKTPSGNGLHWFTLVFGLSILFLAVSSLWMFKPGSRVFKKSMIKVGIGVVVAVLLVIFMK
ncbi:MAG: hypothetical protein R2751_19120 [Bacteroidales bacterium]